MSNVCDGSDDFETSQGLHWTAEDVQGHQFPKLRLKVRLNLVQLAGGTQQLPICDPEVWRIVPPAIGYRIGMIRAVTGKLIAHRGTEGSHSSRSAHHSARVSGSESGVLMQARATPLSPSQWQDMLRTAVQPATLQQSASQDSSESSSQSAVVLDVRNAYEWDAGHFVGAARPLEVPHPSPHPEASSAPAVPLPYFLCSHDTPVMAQSQRSHRYADQMLLLQLASV